MFVAAMLVVWISRTQKCVSQSTSEAAEYLAMGDGVKEDPPKPYVALTLPMTPCYDLER